MKRFLAALFLMALIPYVTTLAWTGRLNSEDLSGFSEFPGISGKGDGPFVVVERGGRETAVSVETFLPGVLAAQIPAEYGIETIKAQAVLARTWIYGELNGRERITEEELDLDVWSRSEMEKRWGKGHFSQNYGKLETAVRETDGLVMTWEETWAEPFFCRAAAGRTRSMGDAYPHLKSAESRGDLAEDGFLTVLWLSPADMAERIRSIPDAVSVAPEDLPEQLQIVKRDEAGYVEQIQIGTKTYSGEEVQNALGLPSSCYRISEMEGKLRISCQGIGHGYGFSQAGANGLEKEGMKFQELLHHYFQNVEISKISGSLE